MRIALPGSAPVQDAAGSPQARKWSVVILLAFAGALNYADRSVLSGVLPLLRADLGLTDVELGSLGSAFLWSYALASPLAGIIADRVPRRRMVAVSVLAWSLVMACTGFIGSLWQLLAARILLGLAESLYLPAAVALISEHHLTNTRATALSIHSVGLSIGVIAGGTAAGYLGEQFGWRAGFWALGAVGVLLAAVLHHLLPPAPRSSAVVRTAAPPLLQNLLTLARIPSFLVILAKAMLSGVGTWIFFNWLPLYYRETLHLSLSQAGFAGTFLLQVGAMLGITLGGLISDRLASTNTANRMLFYGIASLAAAPTLLPFFGTPGLLLVNLSIFAFALVKALGQSNESPILCDVVEPRLRSTAQGFMNTSACLAGGAGVLVAGMLKAEFGLAGVFAGISGLFLVGGTLVVIAYFLLPPRDPKLTR